MKNNCINSFLKIFSCFIVLSIILTVFIFFLLPIIVEKIPLLSDRSTNNMSSFGVVLAAIASLFTGLFLLLQLLNQEDQKKSQKLERFENTYFELLNSLNQHIQLTEFKSNPREKAILTDQISIKEKDSFETEETPIISHDAYTKAYSKICDLSKWKEGDNINDIQSKFRKFMKSDFKYSMRPFFYKFMKIVEHVLRAKDPISREKKCLYISIILDNLTNAETALLLLYFIAVEEINDDEKEIIFYKNYRYQRFFEDCNIFRYLEIDNNWKDALSQNQNAYIPGGAFEHPKLNSQITRKIYEAKKPIIHSWKYTDRGSAQHN